MAEDRYMEWAWLSVREKFRSGNGVPVERAMITREEWESMVHLYEEALKDATHSPPQQDGGREA